MWRRNQTGTNRRLWTRHVSDGACAWHSIVFVLEPRTKEYQMHWRVNTNIRVAPRTTTHAELILDEEEFHGDFSLRVRFSGSVSATIAMHQSPNTYLQFMKGDIVQIFRETLLDEDRWKGFDIIDDPHPSVQFTMRGTCSFRYGIAQHVVLHQEPLDSSTLAVRARSVVFTTVADYRPSRANLTLSTVRDKHSIDLDAENEDRV
jgi:hypothetical protein